MNGVVRLVWTYLYRCQESASTTTTKLDNLLKYFFPPNRLSISPPDENLEPFICIIHFILSRHWEHGRDICLELMQETAIKTLQSSSGNIGGFLAPERTTIAIQAVLLSLNAIEREVLTPTWPSGCDFSVVASREDYPTSSEFAPAPLIAKPGMQDFFDRFGSTLGAISLYCYNLVGHMSLFDEQWAYARLNLAYEESHNYVIRRHLDGTTVAYSSHFTPHISMMQTCFRSWPRCLHSSVPLDDAVDMLLRGVIHVEPQLGEVASLAIKRFMSDSTHALAVLSRFTTFLSNSVCIAREGSGIRLLIESAPLLNLWVSIVDGWIHNLIQQSRESLMEEGEVILSQSNDIEVAALFLLSHESWPIHAAGVRIMRILGLLVAHMTPDSTSPSDGPETPLHFVERLHGKGLNKSYLSGYDDLLEKPELARLEQWRQSKRVDILLRVADSTNEKDRKLWRYIFPAFMQTCMDHSGPVLGAFRHSLVAAASRYHPTISQLAGLSTRVGLPRNPANVERDGPKFVKDNKPLIDQWHIWVKVLCSTATLSEAHRAALAPRDHSRAPSDTTFERERLSTTRGLFRYLTPFLDSEYTLFRDAAVLCISSFPSSAYPQLLEDLSLLAGRQFYDDPRSKSGAVSAMDQNARQLHDESKLKSGAMGIVDRTRRQERLHSAVARIYYLTAHFLQLQRSTGRQAALANVLKFVRNTQTFLTAPEMRDNYTLQRLRRYFCGTVERLFDGLAILMDSDRFIPPHMHLTLYRLCEEWCQLGPQSDVVKQRSILMQRAAASSGELSESRESVERFRRETTMLSQAAVGALSSLCVRTLLHSLICDDTDDHLSKRLSSRLIRLQAPRRRSGLLLNTSDL